jgi:hypothetical protein
MADERANPEKLRVFISYSRDDLSFADQLDATLRLAGFASTLDRHGISGGENWEAKLELLIRSSDTVVFVLSPASAGSKVCAWEVNKAVELGKRIIPVVPRSLEGAAAPHGLATLNYVYFYPEPRKPGTGFGQALLELDVALKANPDWLRKHTRLLQQATEWEAGDRSKDRLLYGNDVGAAETWLATRPKDAPAPTESQIAYIRASADWLAIRQNEDQKRLEERERLVKATEAAAREKAEAARQAEVAVKERGAALALVAEEQRAREVAIAVSLRNRRLFTVAGASFLALALGVGVWATLQSRAAERRQAIVAASLVERAMEGQFYEHAMRVGVAAMPFATRSPLAIGWGEREVRAAEAKLASAAQSSPLRRVLKGHGGSVNAVAFSHDGKLLASASSDRTIHVWDAANGADILTIKGHGSIVQSVSFSPDGLRVASSATDRTVRVWNAKTGTQLYELRGFGRPVQSIAWSPDGKQLVTGSLDGSIEIWDIASHADTGELALPPAVQRDVL